MASGPLDLGEEGDYRPMAEINVTPLVDVMLVLLIVFMVAAPLLMVGVPVQLPKTRAANIDRPREPVIVTIDREGRTYVGQDIVAEEALVGRLRSMAAEDPGGIVYVRGDRSIPYGRIMEVMGRVSAAGFEQVSLLAEALPPSPDASPPGDDNP